MKALTGNSLHIITGLSVVGSFVTFIVTKDIPSFFQTLTMVLVGGSAGVSLPVASTSTAAKPAAPVSQGL